MPRLFSNTYQPFFERPTVELSTFREKNSLPGQIFGYLNYFGPTCSAKDALAEGMLAIAAEKGHLLPNQPIIETASGNFAAALTIAAKRRGHKTHLVIPGNVPLERRRFLQSLGANVVTTSPLQGEKRTLERALQLEHELRAYYINHAANDYNLEFHRRVTGPAIQRICGESLDAIVSFVDSGATISGASEFLKAWLGNIHVAAVQIAGTTSDFSFYSSFADQAPSPIIGENYNPYIVNEVFHVGMGNAKDTAQDAISTEALPLTTDGGAVLYAAAELCKRENFKRIVCIFNKMEIYG